MFNWRDPDEMAILVVGTEDCMEISNKHVLATGKTQQSMNNEKHCTETSLRWLEKEDKKYWMFGN